MEVIEIHVTEGGTVAAEDPFDPESYDALLRIDVQAARRGFPEIFDGGSA